MGRKCISDFPVGRIAAKGAFDLRCSVQVIKPLRPLLSMESLLANELLSFAQALRRRCIYDCDRVVPIGFGVGNRFP